MNELEMLMIAESKKNAIDDELIKDEQQSEPAIGQQKRWTN